MMFSITNFHPGVMMLAFFQGTQLSLFESFLTRAIAGINSTSITSGMQTAAYVVLLIGFLWQVYQSAMHGGDVRGLGTSLAKYVVTAVVVMNYSTIFTTINQGFVNSGNWISNAAGAGNLFDNWKNDIQTQYNQAGIQQMWGLITGSIAGLIDALLIIVAYILYPIVIAVFGFFYIFYGSVLYIFGPIAIALMPLGATNRIAKAYVENVFIWNSWPILYGGFGALLSAVQMGQVGQMLNQNNFLGGLGNIEGSVLIGIASIIYSLAIAVIPFIAKRIVTGDVGSTAGALIGAAATALTVGAAAVEGAAAGAAAGGAGAATGTPTGTSAGGSASGAVPSGAKSAGSNSPTPPQQGPRTASAITRSTAGISAETSSRGTSGESMFGGQPTIEGHAEQIRGHIGEAMDVDSSVDQSPSDASPSASAPANTKANGGSGASGRMSGGRSASSRKGPSVRRYDVGTWGAYHAARLATQSVVGAGRSISGAAQGLLDAAGNPIETAGRVGAATGRASGTVINRAANAGRAIASAGGALRHPVATARSSAAAASGAVADLASQVSDTARRSVSSVRTRFSDAYGDSRRGNGSKSNQE
jgi:hypothetical protein